MADALQISLGAPCAIYAKGINAAFVNFTLNASTDAAEYIFQTPEAITITKLGFRYGLRTGTPPTFKISLQGVSVAGTPDGTIKGGASPASATFTPPADTTWDGTWQWITLANTYGTTRGEFLSIVIAYDSGTIDGTNNSSFTTHATHLTHNGGFLKGYSIQNDAGVRTIQIDQPIFGYQSSTTAYGFPLKAINNTTFNSASTPDEYALRFLLPAGWGSTFQVGGVRWRGNPAGANDVVIVLYSGTTVLQNVSFDRDFDAAPFGVDRVREYYFDEATLSTLNFGTEYRVGLQPSGAGGSSTLVTLVMAAAADAAAHNGGTSFYLSTRTDAGAWTDVSTERPLMEIIIKDWTGGSARGGRIIGG